MGSSSLQRTNVHFQHSNARTQDVAVALVSRVTCEDTCAYTAHRDRKFWTKVPGKRRAPTPPQPIHRPPPLRFARRSRLLRSVILNLHKTLPSQHHGHLFLLHVAPEAPTRSAFLFLSLISERLQVPLSRQTTGKESRRRVKEGIPPPFH